MMQFIDMLVPFVDMVLHINNHLGTWAESMGPWLYVLMFIIIFAETGLVIAPFLPGDSLLFALGAMTTLQTNPLNVWVLLTSLTIAAILGDATNYTIGQKIGPDFIVKKFPWALKPEHMKKTESFFEKYGAKSIVLARFAPIVRTLVPFVAGVGRMNPKTFFKFNVIGGFLWIQVFIWLGHFFGNLPYIQKNFSMVIFAIIVISVLPMALEIAKARMSQKPVR